MKIGIGNDHAAFDMKNQVMSILQDMGHEVVDYGTHSTDRCDYPIYGEKVANAVAVGEVDCGVLLCGTGIGMSLVANKVRGIRAAAVSEAYSARLSKMHNNSNIICLGARVIGIETAKMILEEWLNAEFEGGRHQDRIDLIMAIQDNQ